MAGLVRILKKHTLWVGFVAVCIPLVSLLCLQYIWLDRLAHMSAIAHQTTFKNYLEAIATEIEYSYRSIAQRALNLPSTPFVRGEVKKVANYWNKQSLTGIKSLYVVDYTQSKTGNFYIYDAKKKVVKPTWSSEESLAVVIACLPWVSLVRDPSQANQSGLQINEQDSNYRIMLSPVLDGHMKTLGVAVLIIDQEYFRDHLLSKTIAKLMPSFFPRTHGQDLVFRVRDSQQNVIVGPTGPEVAGSVTQRFGFVFTDWTMSLHSLESTPEQLARASFTFNMTVAGFLILVLLGGIILALRAADKAMRLSEMKSDFVSNVSHELRTPLASIRVFAELLRMGRATSPEKVREYGEYIDVESHRLSRLIDNILDFSRIETKRKTYRFVSCNLEDIVESVLKAFSVRLKKEGIVLNLDLPPDTLPPVDVDADAISQALHNLLDNAVKYSGDSKRINVRLAAEGQWAVLSVNDSGIGIAKEEQSRIFDRFHRVGTGLVHDIKGSGLGLSIINHIVKAHSGRLIVESELGRGSTFSIRLPFSKPNSDN